MTHLKGKKILLVTDAYKRGGSPALVARHLIELIKSKGGRVAVYSEDIDKGPREELNEGVLEFPRPANRFPWFSQVFRMEDAAAFAKAVREFHPDIIHFIPISNRQPRFLFEIAKSSGAHVVGQLWGPGFYCSRNYAYINGNICTKCADGGFYHALMNRCYSAKQLFLKVLSMYLFRPSFQLADCFLSPSLEMDERLEEYGVPPKKIQRFPLPFSRARCEGLPVKDEGYIIFYGQALPEKGIQFLPELARRLPQQKFEFYFSGAGMEAKQAKMLKELRECPSVTIRTDLFWATGLAERVAGSRAVLIPSLWPTTTETVLMEALGLGKPVIAFNVGVHADLLKDNANALVCTPGDVNCLVEAVSKLSNNPELRQELGKGARMLFEDLTDTERLTEILDTAYKLSA